MKRDVSHSDSSDSPAGLLDRELSRRRLLTSAAAGGIGASALGAFATRASGATARGGARKKQLLVAIDATPAGIDPTTFGGPISGEVYESCYSGLTEWRLTPGPRAGSFGMDWTADPKGTIPKLASSWTISRDRRVYTYRLRKGLKSHAGNELTAADVKWTYDRSREVKGIGSFLNDLVHLKEVRVLDRYTVPFRLAAPTPSWPVDLNDSSYRGPLDSTEIKKHATKSDPWGTKWLASNAAGWGPYRLSSLVPGSQLTLTAVEGWPFPAKTPEIILKVVPQSSDRLALLARGAVDVAQFLAPQELKKLEKTPGVKIWNFQSNSIAALSLSFNDKPLDNQKVRQALAYAIPYDAIVQKVYLGYAKPAYGPLPSYSPGLVIKSQWPYKLDYDRAKQLLQEGGQAGGFTTTYVYPTSDPLGELIGVQLRSSFANIGVTLNLQSLPESPYQTALYQAKAPIVYSALGGDLPNPSYTLPLFYGPGGAANFTKYANPKVHAMLARADKMASPTQQNQYLKTAVAKALIADVPWLWIAEPGYQIASRSNVTGLGWYDGVTRWQTAYATA
jgi:peptide/nickel transport system substrate-binding protein